jgi:hypothetical protein
MNQRRTCTALRFLWALLIAIALYSSTIWAAEPLNLHLGALTGLQDGRLWVIGTVAEAGPPDGAQVRVGATIGLLGEAPLLQLETLVLVNFRLGAWVYLGGGVAVIRSSGPSGGFASFPLLAAVGLRSRPAGPWRFTVEGMLFVNLPLDRGFSTRASAGVLLSF